MSSARRSLPLKTVASESGEHATASAADAQWIRHAFAEHSRAVHRLAVRLLGTTGEADDVVQEAFLVAWRRRSLFVGPLPRSWLYGVTVRLCSSIRRRSKWRRFLGLEAAVELPSAHAPEAGLEQHEATRQVYAALNTLTEKKRVVFILYELEGWSGEEIASALSCPLKTVWTRLHHARREFREHLLRRAPLERKEG